MELDYESPHKRFELIVRAASPPLRSDVHVEILVTDVNDNAPKLKDFQVSNMYLDVFQMCTHVLYVLVCVSDTISHFMLFSTELKYYVCKYRVLHRYKVTTVTGNELRSS